MPYSMNPQLRNVIFLSIGFLFNQFALFTQGLIEEATIHKLSQTVNINKHAGYISMAIFYGSFAFGNFFSAPIVNSLNTKMAMIVGSITYAIYMFGFVFLNKIFLYASSALMGFVGTWLWVGQGKYLSLNSDKNTAGRHSAIFFTIYNLNLIFGGIFLLIMYQILNNPEQMSLPTVKLLYGIFTGVALLAVGIFAFLPTVKPDDAAIDLFEEPSHWKIMKRTASLFATKKSLLLSVGSAQSGVLISFWSGIYPTIVDFTRQLDGSMEKSTIVALTVLLTGFGQALGGLSLTALNLKYPTFSREIVVISSTLLQLIAYASVFLTFPSISSLSPTDNIGVFKPSIVLTLSIAFILGFSYILLMSSLFSHILTVYPDNSLEAFSINQFCETALTCVAFICGTVLTLYAHLTVLTCGAISACLCFISAENLHRKEVKSNEYPLKIDSNS